jgi:predicted AAA+ superfamily ATPase
MVYYRRIRYASAARNCLDGLKTQGRTLHILYEKRDTTHTIRDWMANHPRIVLPIMAVLLGGLSFLIFDPIRAWFIESKVQGRFDLSKYRAFAWLRRETLGRLGLDRTAKTDRQITGIEKERQEAASLLDSWLKDWPDGFIVITGPRGSGKEPLIQSVVNSHP